MSLFHSTIYKMVGNIKYFILWGNIFGAMPWVQATSGKANLECAGTCWFVAVILKIGKSLIEKLSKYHINTLIFGL